MPTKEEMRKFSEIIEGIVKEKRVEYMDAVIMHCEEIGFEVELAATLLTPPIKAKISEEAQAMNLIKRVNKLPL
jgi:Phage late-transcription coactivator